MPSQVDEGALLDALKLAKTREPRYVAASSSATSSVVTQQMSRIRAMAMMGGSYHARITLTIDFDFQKEAVSATCTGQVSSFESLKETCSANK